MDPTKPATNLSQSDVSQTGHDAWVSLRQTGDPVELPAVEFPAKLKSAANVRPPKLNVEPPNLNQAIRRARIDSAEYVQGFGDLRSVEIARLEILQENLEPVLAQLPHGQELFDTGIVPGEVPRLFIDMIAFVQMGRDKRTYEFKQDRRDGRFTLAQTGDVDAMTRAITDYIARRLVQREQALASTETLQTPPAHDATPAADRWKNLHVTGVSTTISPADTMRINAKTPAITPPGPAAMPHLRRHGWFMRSLLFLVEFFGVAALLAALIAAGFYAYLKLSGLN